MSISHGAPHPASLRPIKALLDVELAIARPRCLYVVPTTQVMLESIASWRKTVARLWVVAPSTAGGLTSMQLLEELQSADHQDTCVVIVFSDQLTSAVDAPLLVEQAGTLLYLSGLEVVAHRNYQFEVKAWTGNTLESVSATATAADILWLLYRHLKACQTLGSQWLMRDCQAERYPGERIAQARLRLLTLHSVVMHAFAESALPPIYRAVVERIQERSKHLNVPMDARDVDP